MAAIMGYAAAAGVSAIGSFLGGGNRGAMKDQANAQKIQAAQNVIAQNEQVIKANQVGMQQNEALLKANVENTIRTGYRVGLLNMQMGALRKQSTQMGYNANVQARDALDKANANSAAAGTIGASVDAVETDIRMRLGEAHAARNDWWDMNLLNYDTSLHDIVQAGQDQLNLQGIGPQGTAVTLDVSTIGVGQGGSGNRWTNALLAGATSFATNYASRTLALGLGTPKPTPVPYGPE